MGEFTATIHSFKEVAVKTLEVTFKLDDPLDFKAGQLIELCLNETICKDRCSDCQKLPILTSPDTDNLITVVLRDTSECYKQSLLTLSFGSKVVMSGPFEGLYVKNDLKRVGEALTQKSHEDTSNLELVISEMKVKEIELENTKKAILNILEDLDEEKKAVERRVEERTAEIQREKEKLQQVTKNIKDGVILLDSEGLVIFANEGLYRLFGWDQEAVTLPKVLEEVSRYFKETNFGESLTKCLQGEALTLSEVESQGKIFEIFFNNLQVKNDGKDDINYFVLFTDITEAKLLERSKSELVAVASHQLRTPLTAVRGNIEMLVDESYGPLNPQQRELLSDVDISTARLIGMVNDMLDITKIERGNLDMVLEYVSIKETIDSICSDLQAYAKRRGVVIESNITDDSIVYGDKSRVRQVLQNLIDNSIKYSKKTGVVHISSYVERNFVKFILKDNGLGIPKVEQSKIFNRFYRASNTKKSSSSGSGLGLYIVKSIVGQLHGDIRFESEEDVGTTFYVSLPTSSLDTVV
jgi:two-component system phosphate regulon sensor histidine kinase PhoR